MFSNWNWRLTSRISKDYASIQNARLRDAGSGQLSIPLDGVIRISDEQKAIDRPIEKTLAVAGVQMGSFTKLYISLPKLYLQRPLGRVLSVMGQVAQVLRTGWARGRWVRPIGSFSSFFIQALFGEKSGAREMRSR